MQTTIDLETLVELVTRSVVKVLKEKEQEPKPQPIGWQSSAKAAQELKINALTLVRKLDKLKLNRDYRLVPGNRIRYQFHVENCREKLYL